MTINGKGREIRISRNELMTNDSCDGVLLPFVSNT